MGQGQGDEEGRPGQGDEVGKNWSELVGGTMQARVGRGQGQKVGVAGQLFVMVGEKVGRVPEEVGGSKVERGAEQGRWAGPGRSEALGRNC